MFADIPYPYYAIPIPAARILEYVRGISCITPEYYVVTTQIHLPIIPSHSAHVSRTLFHAVQNRIVNFRRKLTKTSLIF